MQELGFKEMSQIEQKLNYAQKDWDYDTRNLQKDDNALQLIIKNKLQKHFKNTPAKEALMRLREEVRENRLRWERMRKLWNSGDLNEVAVVCEIGKDMQKIFGTEANCIQIKAETMESHKKNSKFIPPKGVKKPNTHPEIGAFEYSLIPFMLKSSDCEIYKDNEKIYIIASKLNLWYRLALKNLPEKKEIWVSSLLSKADKKDLEANLKGKVRIK